MNKRLQRALEEVVLGDSETAVEELESFVQQVTSLTTAGELTREEADPLLQQARALIEKLVATGSSASVRRSARRIRHGRREIERHAGAHYDRQASCEPPRRQR